MATLVMIRDESMSGKSLNELTIEIPDERVTVEEIIRSRVYQEVKEFNARAASAPEAEFQGLVRPTEMELTLNGQRPKKQPIDWRRQLERAIQAFQSNQILILVGGRQVNSLDEEITVDSSMQISFLRLTMLMGG